jgi:hypothetical protein
MVKTEEMNGWNRGVKIYKMCQQLHTLSKNSRISLFPSGRIVIFIAEMLQNCFYWYIGVTFLAPKKLGVVKILVAS